MTDEELQWNKIVGGKKASKCWRSKSLLLVKTPEIYDNDGEKINTNLHNKLFSCHSDSTEVVLLYHKII